MSALDKVLRLAAPGQAAAEEPEGAQYVRAAAQDLDELALLLAKSSDDDEDDDDEDDPDHDGDDDSTAKGDTDHDYWTKDGKKKKPLPKGKKKKSDRVKASALLLDAMLALHQLAGGEHVSLSVLTAAERKKPSAHTIPGTEDYPIPDKGHLSAAIARYKEGKLAGHPASVVKKHILSRARALGVQVELSALETDSTTALLRLARGSAAPVTAMEHGPHNGSHSHPHRVVQVVDGEHYHNHDSRHGGDGY